MLGAHGLPGDELDRSVRSRPWGRCFGPQRYGDGRSIGGVEESRDGEDWETYARWGINAGYLQVNAPAFAQRRGRAVYLTPLYATANRLYEGYECTTALMSDIESFFMLNLVLHSVDFRSSVACVT